MTLSLEELQEQRKEIDAQIAAERKKTAAQRQAERVERDRIERERINAKLDDEHAWHTDAKKDKYALAADAGYSHRAGEPNVVFTISEWGEFREEVVVSGSDLIALRDWLNSITA